MSSYNPKNDLIAAIHSHRAGDMKTAIEGYDRILSIFPDHPDANHNLALIEVDAGKIDQAVERFKIAINKKPEIEQFWRSYIRVLISRDLMTDAKAVLQQAKSFGLNQDKLSRLEQLLLAHRQNKPAEDIDAQRSSNLVLNFNNQKFDLVISEAEKLLSYFPKSIFLRNIKGLSLMKLGSVELAVKDFSECIELQPSEPQWHFNMGIALKEMKLFEEALSKFDTVISMNPNFNGALHNKADILSIQKNYLDAINTYKQALSYSVHDVETLNNLAVLQTQVGNIPAALQTYTKLLAINENVTVALENALGLITQIIPDASDDYTSLAKIFSTREVSTSEGPRALVFRAIRSFINEDFATTREFIKRFQDLDHSKLSLLSDKNRIFCFAYANFLKKLSDFSGLLPKQHQAVKVAYHLGDSHCLSYAHHSIQLGENIFKIKPLISFGCKAYHLSRTEPDIYKAITKLNFCSVPNASTILLSFGEIDCRENEGFIVEAKKRGVDVDKLIEATVAGYVSWFEKLNLKKKHNVYFLNVPAPVYGEDLEHTINKKRKEIVTTFNNSLQRKIAGNTFFHLLDVYNATSTSDGFSNGYFHLDERHLGPSILPTIARQL